MDGLLSIQADNFFLFLVLVANKAYPRPFQLNDIHGMRCVQELELGEGEEQKKRSKEVGIDKDLPLYRKRNRHVRISSPKRCKHTFFQASTQHHLTVRIETDGGNTRSGKIQAWI